MAYYDTALLAQDGDFYQRIAAAAAVEIDLAGKPAPVWAGEHQWQLAAAPGFGDAYASAVASGVPSPGRDPAVISDAQLLSAIQALPPDTPPA